MINFELQWISYNLKNFVSLGLTKAISKLPLYAGHMSTQSRKSRKPSKRCQTPWASEPRISSKRSRAMKSSSEASANYVRKLTSEPSISLGWSQGVRANKANMPAIWCAICLPFGARQNFYVRKSWSGSGVGDKISKSPFRRGLQINHAQLQF